MFHSLIIPSRLKRLNSNSSSSNGERQQLLPWDLHDGGCSSQYKRGTHRPFLGMVFVYIICVCVYIYIYTHIHTLIYIVLQYYIYIVLQYIYICVCVYIYIYTHTNNIYICCNKLLYSMCVCVYIYIYIYCNTTQV